MTNDLIKKIINPETGIRINIPPFLKLTEKQISDILKTLEQRATKRTIYFLPLLKKDEPDREYFLELYKQTFPERTIIPSSLEQQMEEIKEVDKLRSVRDPYYLTRRFEKLVDYLKNKKKIKGLRISVEEGATFNEVAHDFVLMEESSKWKVTECVRRGALDSVRDNGAMNNAIGIWEEIEKIIKNRKIKYKDYHLPEYRSNQNETAEDKYFREKTDYLFVAGEMSQARYKSIRDLPIQNLRKALTTFEDIAEKRSPNYWQNMLEWYESWEKERKGIKETPFQQPQDWLNLTDEGKAKISLREIENYLAREI